MKALKSAFVLLAIVLGLSGCSPETGNPNLAGPWSCEETSQIYMNGMKGSKGTSIYTVNFERDAVVQDKYRIDNFYKLGNGIKVTILKDGYTITIPRQSVDGFVFEGSGAVNETFDIIQVVYTADDGGGEIDHVTAEYTR